MIEDPIIAAWIKDDQARYDELADRIHLYYHLDATIESDVAEFGELRLALGKASSTDPGEVPSPRFEELRRVLGKEAA